MGVRKKKGKKGSEIDQASRSSSNGGSKGSEDEGEVEGGAEVSLNAASITQVIVPATLDSGVVLLQGNDNSLNSDEDGSAKSGQRLLQKEASKLLEIQKSVDFSFELEDMEVCERMVADELRDREQKVVREQTIGDQ
ncbi:hypothetical protein P8452_61671 [Trifolium repens]|jgi:hypothetical protein|nr:hypothetical protein P8452_61671 [Trifolium repens]